MAETYMTADRELATLFDVFAGVAATYSRELGDAHLLRFENRRRRLSISVPRLRRPCDAQRTLISVGAGIGL